jgi:hypothetical protein
VALFQQELGVLPHQQLDPTNNRWAGEMEYPDGAAG